MSSTNENPNLLDNGTQYFLNGNELTLEAKKAPFILRAMMYLFAFISFILPITGMIIGLAAGNGFHFIYFLSIVMFGLIGFYLLRVSLWNSFGKETIRFNKEQIIYEADYGWFKDGKKEINRHVEFGIRHIGYENDNEGALIIGLDEPSIKCVTKMPNSEIELLIEKLKALDHL